MKENQKKKLIEVTAVSSIFQHEIWLLEIAARRSLFLQTFIYTVGDKNYPEAFIVTFHIAQSLFPSILNSITFWDSCSSCWLCFEFAYRTALIA